jgi:hypothetical protein
VATVGNPNHLMRNRAAGQGEFAQTPPCPLGGLPHGFGNFARAASAKSKPAHAVADNHKRGKAEPAPAFDDFRAPANVHNLLFQSLLSRLVIAVLCQRPIIARKTPPCPHVHG